MAQTELELERFLSIVRPWFPGYRGAWVSYIAARKDGGLHLVSGEISLVAAKGAEKPMRVSTPIIIAGRYWMANTGSDFIDALCRAIRSGALITSNATMVLPPAASSSIYVNDAATSEGIRLPEICATGGQLYAVLERKIAEWELRSLNRPYRDLSDLARACGLNGSATGDHGRLSIFANPVVDISPRSHVKNQTATVHVKLARGLRPGKVKIGWVVSGKKKLLRGSKAGQSLKWFNAPGALAATFRLTVPTGTSGTFLLSYMNTSIVQRTLHDESAGQGVREQVFRAFDKSLGHLRSMLFPDEESKVTARSFEAAVALLLTMRGFSTSHTNQQLQERLPDLVAFSKEGLILLVECTLGALTNKGKLTKLVSRRNALRREFHKHNESVEIRAIIVSCKPEEDIAPEIHMAREQDVGVATREDLEWLISRASGATPPAALVRRLLPSPSDQWTAFLKPA